jgi:glycerol-3-phosphate acyltransferase PlsY
MDTALRIVAAGLSAYLVGSVPWAVIVVRIFWKQDIRTLGSGNTGATNVLRVFGTAPGVVVLLLDGAKGALGVWLASLFTAAEWGASGSDWLMALGALAAIAGHTFSPFIGFRGGKGIATAAGAIAVLAPLVWPVLLAIFLVAAGASRMVSIGSIALAAVFPVVCWVVYPDRLALLLFALLASALVLWRHRSNMARIARGEEPRVRFNRRQWDEMRSRHNDGGE